MTELHSCFVQSHGKRKDIIACLQRSKSNGVQEMLSTSHFMKLMYAVEDLKSNLAWKNVVDRCFNDIPVLRNMSRRLSEPTKGNGSNEVSYGLHFNWEDASYFQDTYMWENGHFSGTKYSPRKLSLSGGAKDGVHNSSSVKIYFNVEACMNK